MDEALPEGIRTAVFVDFENVHYHDPKAYGPEGAKRFAEDLLTVAHECGPVVLAQAVAPWEALPGCAAALHDAGFDPVYCRGAMKNEADLLVVQKLAGLDERTGVRVVFLVSGDGHMTGATREAQAAGLRVVVVSAASALSPKLKASAD
ncbi:MAG: NYN domain-containing protein, partial [Firmicutes bacterium]|nr:NYN domain-containing protein [Bacillota bacterium]